MLKQNDKVQVLLDNGKTFDLTQTELHLENTQIKDLAGVENLDITYLNLENCWQLQSIDSIMKSKTLKSVRLPNGIIFDTESTKLDLSAPPAQPGF